MPDHDPLFPLRNPYAKRKLISVHANPLFLRRITSVGVFVTGTAPSVPNSFWQYFAKPSEQRGASVRGIVRGLVSSVFPGMLIVLFLSPLAYAGPRFADYPQRRANECAIKADKLGLVVGIQPVEDPNDQKSYFDSDLTRKGFIPVYIVIENQSSSGSFLFDKADVKMGVGTPPGSGPDVNSKGVQTLQVVSALAISPVGMIIGLKLAKDEALIQTNLLKREIQSKTQTPATSTSGFLYLPVPKTGPRQPIHLAILVTRSGDDEPFSLDFNF